MIIDSFLKQLEDLKLVPVISLNSADSALPLGETLLNSGLPVAEITIRTDAAVESIKRLSQTHPDLLVGAGTVLTVEQAKQAFDAGAKFLVTPGFSHAIVQWSLDNQIPIIPGIMTPSELMQAHALGINVMKFYPAEAAGGVRMLKALAGPFPFVRFMPTGGINLNNIKDYLALPQVIACGGSWIVPQSLIDSANFQEIGALVREAQQHINSRG